MKPFQFITHSNSRFDYIEGARLALEGGCRWIQLRMKDKTDSEIEAAAARLKPLCSEYGAVLILNDRVDLALKVKADGVHLGKNDTDPSEARKQASDSFIIGGTANTIDDVVTLAAKGVDYIGLGPFRFTTTKEKLSPVLGIDGYHDIAKQCEERGIAIPIVAIGGITTEDIPALMKTGIPGIAVSAAILSAADPVEETKEILKILNCNYG